MKDLSVKEVALNLADGDSAERMLDYCIDRLLEDSEHELSDLVVNACTFEELLGALAAAKKKIGGLRELSVSCG